MAEHKFPTEVIDLPSQGKLYSKDSPLAEGKIELKYMTTREEDILMSENLIKKGVVIDKLLDSLIVTPNVKQSDLILGDKNAVLVAARILAYGPEYTTEITDPNDINKKIQHTFDLSTCPFRELSDDIKHDGNSFEFTTPVGKNKIKFKIIKIKIIYKTKYSNINNLNRNLIIKINPMVMDVIEELWPKKYQMQRLKAIMDIYM